MTFDRVAAPDYLFAVGSALLWAVSSLVVRRGIGNIRATPKWPSIAVGLLVSLTVGSLTLLLLTGEMIDVAAVSPWTVAAGVLLFPVGTGLYYACGYAFDGRVEFASQFANVKPIVSVAFALALLNEGLKPASILSLVLIAGGIGVLMIAVRHGTFSVSSLTLGLLLAMAWGAGETVGKLGLTSAPSVTVTLAALLSGTALAALIAIPLIVKRRHQALLEFGRWVAPFAWHGVLSFALAYACLFESIKRIGVGQTALITAVWPGLAIVLSRLTNKEDVPSSMMVAAGLLLIGSIVQIITVLMG